MKKEKLQALFDAMTLEEKLGQMTQTTGEFFIGDEFADELVVTGPTSDELGFTEESLYQIGSVLGVSSAAAINKLQETYLAKSRLKIPLMFMHDAIHGYRTIFPIPLALASSFDRELLRQVASATAKEMRVTGIQVDFSPMTDLVRDARWGRVLESYGEDPVVAGELGAAMIEGYQGSADGGRLSNDSVVACLKHFAAYGAPDAGRDYASVDMSVKEFFGFYAKTYELALKAHPKMVMASFNSFNGEPATSSKYLLDKILRDKFDFDELLISDWGAVAELINHGVAADEKEAGKLALDAGIEIEMVSNTFVKYGPALVKRSPKLRKKLDTAVWKILTLKNELGLFENPYADARQEQKVVRNANFVKLAKEAAKASSVLLKNDGDILPLAADAPTILIGPYTKTQELLGNWNCKGKVSETTSLAKAFKAVNELTYAYEYLDEVPEALLEQASSVVVTLGESWEKSGEGHSSSNLEISDAQKSLIFDLKALGKKVIGLGFAGRPLALESVIDALDALLWTWYGGNETGNAVAELVFGLDSPSGRLPMSFPRVTAQTPLRYNELRSGRPANASSYSSRYQDLEIGPLFPFGYGLRYGDVKYSAVKLSSTQISLDGGEIDLTVELTNTSKFDTREPVLLFIEDPVSSLVRPVRELVKFDAVPVKSGETKTAQFSLTSDDLKYVNNQGRKALELGVINFYLNDLTEKVASLEVVK